MNRKKLVKIRQRLEVCRRRGGIGSSELESIAEALGREPSRRGKEPTWVNRRYPDLRPLSIPRHGSRDLNRFTAGSILNQLELDLERWESDAELEDSDEAG